MILIYQKDLWLSLEGSNIALEEGYDPFVDDDRPTTVKQWERSAGEEKTTFRQIEGYKQKVKPIKYGFGYFTDYAWNKHKKEVTVTFVRPKTQHSAQQTFKNIPISSIKLQELGFSLPQEGLDPFE